MKKINNTNILDFEDVKNIQMNSFESKNIKIKNKEIENFLKFVSKNIYQNLKIEYLNKKIKNNDISILNSDANKKAITKSKYIIPLYLLSQYKDIKINYLNQCFNYSNNSNNLSYSIESIFLLKNQDYIYSSIIDLSEIKESQIKNYLENKINHIDNKSKFLLGIYNQNNLNMPKSLNISNNLSNSSISILEIKANNDDKNTNK